MGHIEPVDLLPNKYLCCPTSIHSLRLFFLGYSQISIVSFTLERLNCQGMSLVGGGVDIVTG